MYTKHPLLLIFNFLEFLERERAVARLSGERRQLTSAEGTKVKGGGGGGGGGDVSCMGAWPCGSDIVDYWKCLELILKNTWA